MRKLAGEPFAYKELFRCTYISAHFLFCFVLCLTAPQPHPIFWYENCLLFSKWPHFASPSTLALLDLKSLWECPLSMSWGRVI